MTRILKDGNCFFRAVSHQLYGHQNAHTKIRSSAVDYIKENKSYYLEFLYEPFENYVINIAKCGVWADYIAIDSTARKFNVKINFYERNALKYTVNETAPIVLNLLYKNQNHFDSIDNITTWLSPSSEILKRRKTCNNKRPVVSIINNKTDPIFYENYSNSVNNTHFSNSIKNLYKFEEKLSKYHFLHCENCFERWPVDFNYTQNSLCSLCKINKYDRSLRFSDANEMLPGIPPLCLQQLNFLEVILISRAVPFIKIYNTKFLGSRMSGNCINIIHTPEQILKILPRNLEDVKLNILKSDTSEINILSKNISSEKVINALEWLKVNNPAYSDIIIDYGFCDSNNHPINKTSSKSDSEIYYETCLPNFAQPLLEEDKTSKVLNYVFKGEPINEFNTPYLATYCFPTLFPTSKGDFTKTGTLYEVSWGESIKHLLKYCYIINNKKIYPFSESKLFIFWAYNLLERHRLLAQTKVFLSKEIDITELTLDKIRIILNDPGLSKKFVEKCLNYTANVRGNASYWNSVKGTLQNIVEQKGTPELFFTFSSAESYWADLESLLEYKMPITWSERAKHLQKLTSTINWYFMERFNIFLKVLFDRIYPSKWFWYRVEFQHRGTIHVHGFIKLELKHDLNSLVKNIISYKQKALNNKITKNEFLKWKSHEKILINLVNKYINSAWPNNLDLYNTSNFKCNSHPCSQLLGKVHESKIGSYYKQLSEKCCRHTKCSSSYCLKERKGVTKCRFGFPKDICPKTKIIYTKSKMGQLYVNYEIKRTDPLVNTHNIFQILGWKANVDLQFIFSENHVVEYLTKYVTKSESTSMGLKSFIENSLNKNEDRSIPSILKSAILNKIGGRDVGLMECTHILLGLPLYKSSLEYTTVNLYESKEINLSNNNRGPVIKKSIIDYYKNRKLCQSNMNLFEFACKYCIKNTKLIKRKSNIDNKVVKFVPNYIYIKDTPLYYKYCLLQLVKFKPWRTLEYKFKQSLESEDQNKIIKEWEIYCELMPEYINLGKFSDIGLETDSIISASTGSESNTEPDIDGDMLNQLHNNYLTNNEEYVDPEDVLLEELRRKANQNIEKLNKERNNELSQKCQKSINKFRLLLKTYNNPIKECDLRIDSSKLTVKQKEIWKFFKNKKSQQSLQSLVMILGSAGTGKTFIIKCLKILLEDSIIICATTGKAAINIGSYVQTLHKTFNIPISKTREKDLSSEFLKRFQKVNLNFSYLLIDEISMLNQYTLYWLDIRLKQIKANDQFFGGVTVILCGDIFQLPPVKGSPLYKSEPTSLENQIGYGLYLKFDKIFILDKIMRQNNESSSEFVHILERLRLGNVLTEDWFYLKKNFINNFDLKNDESLHLYATNKETMRYNFNKLNESTNLLYISEALDSHPDIKNVNLENIGNLDYEVYLLIGSPVYLTANYCVNKGLANGTMGVLRDIIFTEMNGKYIPEVLLIEFEIIDQGSKVKIMTAPIDKITIPYEFNYKKTRTQFPIKTAFALTIHKSQGMTLEKITVDIGKRDFCSGLTYVALSRVKDIRNLRLFPFTAERFLEINKNSQTKIRIDEYARLIELHKNK